MTFPKKDSLATYGGALQDYAPVEDPTTDRPASGANQAYASVAALTQTGCIAWCRFIGGVGTLVASGACWGNAPEVRPVVGTFGTGIWSVTWPDTIVDGLGVTQSVLITRARACAEGPTHYSCQVEVTDAATLNVTIHDGTDTASDATGTIIHVEIF